jgi:hypothetical protein
MMPHAATRKEAGQMELKPGSRWKSAVCSTEIAVVKRASDIALGCGGHAMIPVGGERPAGAAMANGHAAGTLVGKRYVDADSGLEVLCTKAGCGLLTANGREMAIREPNRLPSSD